MERVLSAKKVYSGIDLFKLIAAVLVVVLHAVETTAWYPYEVKFVITSMAVPFFFIASGFFFYTGISNAQDKKAYFIKYEKNLLKMFAVWALLIYSPFVVYSYIQMYPDDGVLMICFYLIRRIFIIGPGPYWYLVALMWTAAFLYLCYTKKKEKIMVAAIVIGFILEISYACFQGVLSSFPIFNYFFRVTYFVYSWEFNFFMFGIPFMGIGYFISKYDLKISKKASITVLVFATIIRVFEYNLPKIFPSEFWDNNNISFAFIAQAVALFMLAKSIDLNIKKSTSLSLRQLSSCIYFSHAIFLYNIIDPLLDKFTNLPTYADVLIVPKVMVVLMLCLSLFFVVKKIDNKYLNVLING